MKCNSFARATAFEPARLISRQESTSFTAPRVKNVAQFWQILSIFSERPNFAETKTTRLAWLLLHRSPDRNQRLVKINGIYHVKYSVRNSLDKLKHFQIISHTCSVKIESITP